MVAVEVAVFLADDVRHEGGGVRLVLLVGDFDREVAAEALGLAARLRLAQLLGEVQDVLRETDDGDAAAAAGLLKEIVPAGDEILKLVLPEEYRIGRFAELAPEPCPLEDEFQYDVDEPPCLMAILQERPVAEYDPVPVRRILRSKAATAGGPVRRAW